MDPDSSAKTNAPRKVKFAPKAPPKRGPKPVLPKPEKFENDVDDARAEHLLRRLNETSVTGRAKAEKKVGQTQVAFGFGGSSSSIRSFGASKKINGSQASASDGSAIQKEYKEPWDYYSYYPLTVPLRRPYSGNPEILDQEEFDEDPQNTSYNEDNTTPAAELGLLDDNAENNMFFFQLPATLPRFMQSTDAEVQEPEKHHSGPRKDPGKSQKPCKLEGLPQGLMGKMLVYKSGAVKLKLGNTLYDVSGGLDFAFAQDVVAINTEDKHCCNLGELNKRAIVTPDIDSMLADESGL